MGKRRPARVIPIGGKDGRDATIEALRLENEELRSLAGEIARILDGIEAAVITRKPLKKRSKRPK